MSGSNIKKTEFVSFDGSIRINSQHQCPNQLQDLEHIPKNVTRISRGGGYSYAAPSFGDNILTQEMTSFNRILEFDEKKRTVVVESGITLKKLLEWSFGKKLFLRIQPGHPNITIGGCLASNVHGKNPHKDGDFVNVVLEIKLFHPEHGFKILNRTQNSDIFELTCGGLGLTGTILTVKLQLDVLPSDRMIFERIPVESLMDTVKIFQNNLDADFISSWHNGSPSKRNFGKGIAYKGVFADGFKSNKLIMPKKEALTPSSRACLPFSVWNKTTAAIVYSFYRYCESHNSKMYEKNIFDSLFPFGGSAKYYHFLYGKKGLVEYQILVDIEKVEEFVNDLTKLIETEKPPLILIFLKPFRGNQKYLRYSGSGISFALNFQHSQKTNEIISKLENIIISHGAIIHVIKGPSKRVVQSCFPEYNKFIEDLKKFDPKKIYKSDLSEKLGL
jgi:decaprenylphospho-beta-D-ribofuranose 2-oxidase